MTPKSKPRPKTTKPRTWDRWLLVSDEGAPWHALFFSRQAAQRDAMYNEKPIPVTITERKGGGK